MKLYHHKTDGGAEYLCSEKIKNTKNEGSLESKYIIRIDGDIKQDAELFIKDKLSTKKEQKQLTIVEDMRENNIWTRYGLYAKLTEKEAIKLYCKEMSLPCGKIIQKMDAFYSKLTDIRAYKITIN